MGAVKMKKTDDLIHVPQDIKTRIVEKITECIDRFYEKTGYRLNYMPDIFYNVSGTTSGKASSEYNIIYFNPHILMANVDRFITRTVPHELAHIMTYEYYIESLGYNQYNRNGSRKRSFVHGTGWKNVMSLFGVPSNEITRCHDYEVPVTALSGKKKQKRWAYKCECCIHPVSTTLHNKMNKFLLTHENTGRQCTKCHKPLVYTGEQMSS